MTDTSRSGRVWRFRTITFAAFTGLAVFLLENLIDPFVQRDADNTQLWGNMVVAIVTGCIILVPLAAVAVSTVRAGYLEKSKGRRVRLPVSAGSQFLLTFIVANGVFLGLVLLTK